MRARSIRLVLTDNDGVLTDTGVYYNADGEMLKRYSIRDGLGVERLRDAGIETAVITGEQSPSITARAGRLQLPHVFLGVRDKGAFLEPFLVEAGLERSQIAFIGDDVNDMGLISAINPFGLTGAPLDAIPTVAAAVHFHSTVAGGQGAFRDFAEWIISLRDHGGPYRPSMSGMSQLEPTAHA